MAAGVEGLGCRGALSKKWAIEFEVQMASTDFRKRPTGGGQVDVRFSVGLKLYIDPLK